VVGLVSTSPRSISNVDAFEVKVTQQLSEVGLAVTFVEIGPGVSDLDAAIHDTLAEDPDVVVTWNTPA